MKTGILFILTFFSIAAFGQAGKLKLSLTITSDTTYPYFLDIWLLKKDSLINRFTVVKNGDYLFRNIGEGVYSLKLADHIARELKIDSVNILNDSTTTLNIVYPGACKFIYPINYKPLCPYSHSDSIVNIMYGFPSKRMMTESKKGRIYLGGCIVTGCDPKYYCIKHKLQF